MLPTSAFKGTPPQKLFFHNPLKKCIKSQYQSLKQGFLFKNFEPHLFHADMYFETRICHAVTYFEPHISHATPCWLQNHANILFDTYFQTNFFLNDW